MLIDCVPVLGLRLTTARLELRLPEPEELAALAEVAAAGIHDPEYMPFVKPWTLEPAEKIKRSSILSHWRHLGEWKPEHWSLDLAVFFEGEPIGSQNLRAQDFAVTRSAVSGSWLGLPFHGRGLGTEMRAAALHLAFAGLGAEEAVSVAFADNKASQAVSAKFGYVPDGLSRRSAEGLLRFDQRLLLTREAWERHQNIEVTVEGLEPCLSMFGVTAAQ
jgi:RimJ/RimL family protein N-acetyltransferase